MEETDQPSPDANQPQTPNEEPAVPEEDQNYDEQLSEIKEFLPFLARLIEFSDSLNIPTHRVLILESLYEVVNEERLSQYKLSVCKDVFHELFDKYCKPLCLCCSRMSHRHRRLYGI